ncbi:MAG: lipoyl(octanoyl) transferase LipB [Thermoanaerobaculia bacterium]
MTPLSSDVRTTAAGYLGLVGYHEGVKLQERVRAALCAGVGSEHLLLLEHRPVFTLGRTAKPTDIVVGKRWLEDRGVQVADSDRGGQVTFHGPGQLVGYPVIDLKPDRRDVRKYVRDLQQVLVRALADFGIDAEPRHEQSVIGVWVGSRKIASIGVHLSRWITTHGFALNVSTDLSFFQGIVPCGLQRVEMTSIEALMGEAPAVSAVAAACSIHFGEVFDRRMIPLDVNLWDWDKNEGGAAAASSPRRSASAID